MMLQKSIICVLESRGKLELKCLHKPGCDCYRVLLCTGECSDGSSSSPLSACDAVVTPIRPPEIQRPDVKLQVSNESSLSF